MKKFLTSIFVITLFLTDDSFANFELNLNKGIASFYKSEYETSIEFLNMALNEEPENATANHIIGLSYYHLRNYDEAIKYLEIAKQFDPKLVNIDLDLATVYIKTNNYENAVEVLKQFLSNNPDHGIGYYYLGFAQYSGGKYKEAIESLSTAKKLNPDLSLQSNFYQGVCYYQLFEYEKSREKFQEVVKADSGSKLEISAKEYLNVLRTLGKNYYVNISAGYQYDTNVGLEPENIKIFTNEKDSSAFFYANLGYKPYFKNGDVIGLDYKTFFNFHDELKEFNIQNHTFSAYGAKSLKNYSKPMNLFLDYSYQIVFIDGSPADELFSQSHIVIPGITVRWSDTVTSRVFYQFRYNDFEDLPQRDAYNNSLTWAQFYNYYNGRLVISPGAKLELNSADDMTGERSFTYWSPEIFIQALAAVQYDVTIYTRLHYYYQDYYNDLFDRRDNQFGLKFLISKELYDYLYLDLAYDYTYNGSNSNVPGPEPFEYKRNIFTLGLSLKL